MIHAPESGLRRELLTASLRHACETIPFYRDDPALTALSEPGLNAFPIVDKRLIAARLFDFTHLDRFPDHVIASGGTSGGPPNVSFRNVEEYEAVHVYLTGHVPGTPPDLDQFDGFTLDVFFNSNGYSWRKAPGWPMLSVILEQPVHADLIRQLIAEGLPVRGRRMPVRRMQAQNGPLRCLTGDMVAQDFRPAQHDLDGLLVYGGHVAQVWQSRLREVWGVVPETVYGLSEFGLGNAMTCPACGNYHYWTAWPEFFSLDWRGPIEQGDAHLVLTSLAPFTYVQPRIRYWTEDIVQVAGRCSATGELGFRFRGRASSSAVAETSGGRHVLFSEIDALEAAERVEGVARRVHSCEAQLWATGTRPRPPFQMGFPKFAVRPYASGDGLTRALEVAVECTFDPVEAPDRAARLRDAFLDALSDACPHALAACESHGLRPDIVPLTPGGLGQWVKTAQ